MTAQSSAWSQCMRRLAITNPCEQCGESYHPWSHGQQYCGFRCRSIALYPQKKLGKKGAPFWSRVAKREPDECWEWTGARMEVGYGAYRLPKERGGKLETAHREAWRLTHPDQPIGDLLVLHSCDNRPCVNPAHLWLGTHKDNTRDMFAKGRNGGRLIPGGKPGRRCSRKSKEEIVS